MHHKIWNQEQDLFASAVTRGDDPVSKVFELFQQASGDAVVREIRISILPAGDGIRIEDSERLGVGAVIHDPRLDASDLLERFERRATSLGYKVETRR